MNKTIRFGLLYTALGAAFALTACVDNDKDMSTIPTIPPGKTVDLIIPADFQWKSTDRVTMKVNAPVTSVLSVYTDDGCTDASLIATLHVEAGQTTQMELDLPTACKAVYLKYPTGETTSNIVKADVETVAASRADENKRALIIYGDKLHGMYEYTSGGSDEQGLNLVVTSGTVLFEDNWPDLGDYDFNDLVADYRIVTHVSAGKEEHYPYERIDVTFTVRAIYGYLPEKIGLQFLGMDSENFHSLRQKHIDSYAGLEETTAEGLTVKLANPGKMDETPIFWIEGLKNLKRDNAFYLPEMQGDTPATVTFSLYSSLKNNVSTSTAFSQAGFVSNQDIFLVTTDGREIHLRGYKPTLMYAGYDADAATGKGVTMNKSYTYATDKNLVWGMKTVSGFHFPVEKTDIREAYNPYFGQWVQSNGATNTDWYTKWEENKDAVVSRKGIHDAI